MNEVVEIIEVEIIEPKKVKEVKQTNCMSNFLKILSVPTLLFLSVIATYYNTPKSQDNNF